MNNTRAFNNYLDYVYTVNQYNNRNLRNDGNDVVDADINAIEAEVTNNITFFDSGGGAAVASVGAAAPAALGAGAGATGIVAAIPVVGQVVAVIAACVAVGQVFHNMDKAAQYKRIIAKTKAILKEKDTVIIYDQAEHNNQIAILDREILYRETQLARTQQLNTITLCVMGLGGLVFVYGLNRLAKKK